MLTLRGAPAGGQPVPMHTASAVHAVERRLLFNASVTRVRLSLTIAAILVLVIPRYRSLGKQKVPSYVDGPIGALTLPLG